MVKIDSSKNQIIVSKHDYQNDVDIPKQLSNSPSNLSEASQLKEMKISDFDNLEKGPYITKQNRYLESDGHHPYNKYRSMINVRMVARKRC